MIRSARHRAEAVRKDRSEVARRVRGGIPQSGQRLRSGGLADTHEAIAIVEDEKFLGAIEAGVRQERNWVDRVTRADL